MDNIKVQYYFAFGILATFLGVYFFDKKTLLDALKNTDKIDTPPVDNPTISSSYGLRWGQMHNGWDFAVVSGSNVYAVADGKVTIAKDLTPNGCGGTVKIQHSQERESLYCHLKKWLVTEGQNVKKGQIIGYSGGGANDPHKGKSTGAHLHYEIRYKGKSINPKYLHPEIYHT